MYTSLAISIRPPPPSWKIFLDPRMKRMRRDLPGFFFTSCQADSFASKSATIGCSYFYLYLRSFSPLLKAMHLYMIIPKTRKTDFTICFDGKPASFRDPLVFNTMTLERKLKPSFHYRDTRSGSTI